MQKLAREYLDELNKRHRKNRKAIVAWVLLAVLVISTVAGGLTQYGSALTEKSSLTCGQEEHTHDGTCYTYEKVLTCGEEEAEAHTHTEACYGQGELTCGQEETEGHAHTDECYGEAELICGQEEGEDHAHTEACYGEKELTCGQEEAEAHTHTEACYGQGELTCGQEEGKGHTHTEACYTEEQTLTCKLEEHTHSKECYTTEPSEPSETDDESENGAEDDGENTEFSEEEQAQVDEVTALLGALPSMEEVESALHSYEEANGENTEELAATLTRFREQVQAAYDAYMALEEKLQQYVGAENAELLASLLKLLNPALSEEEQAQVDEVIALIQALPSLEEVEALLNGYEDENGENTEEFAATLTQFREQVQAVYDVYMALDEKLRQQVGEENAELLISLQELLNPTLTEEEQQQVDAVIALISALPTVEEIQAVQEAYDNEEMDADAYNEYLIGLAKQVKTVYDAYMALGKKLQRHVEPEKAEYLLMLWEMFGISTLDETNHNAYITGFTITRTVDGTAPFDNHTEHTEKCYEVGHNGNEEKLICKQHIYEDDNEESVPGDDRNADNLVVRTFDSVNYKFRVTMDTYPGTSLAITEARVKLQVILPATKEQASFNLEAMTWVDTAEGYEPEIVDIIRDENGGFRFPESEEDKKNINGQLLTCFKHLESGRAVVPGFFENNLSVDVKSMKNGDTFAPIFYAVMEGGFEYDIQDGAEVPQLFRGEGEDAKKPEKNEYTYTDAHKCPEETHAKIEMLRADAPEIKVSAAPKYNIRIAGADSERRQYNFGDIPTETETTAANQEKGFQTGRMVRLGITLQLYNDNASKGLKGIQLPDETEAITFDLNLESEYQSHKTPDGEIEKKIDVTEEYTPLLWSCGPNDNNSSYGKTNIDGRVIYDGYWGSGLAPYSNGGGEYGCQESGIWEAEQEDSTIHVSVSGYKVDVTSMPSYNQGQDSEVDNVTYGANIGCFSSGVLWILQPFNKEAETDIETDPAGNREPEFDVVKQYGEGVFHTTIKEENMRIKTVAASGTTTVGNEAQMCKTDDQDTRHLELLLPGTMINRVRYSDKDISKGVGVKSIRNGRDYASLGSEIWLMGGFTYYADRKEENQFYYGTSLVKFYGSAIEPLEDQPIKEQWTATAEGEGGSYVPDHSHLQTYFSGGAKAGEISVYYAAKKDGSDWKNDYEMKHTYEDCYVEIDEKTGDITKTDPEKGLVFYRHMADLKADNKLCVGILYCFKGSGNEVEAETNDPAYECFHRAIVKSDDKLLGDGSKPVTFSLVSTSRVWTKSMFERDERWGKSVALETLTLPEWMEGKKLTDFPVGYMKSGNIENSTWYNKAIYYDDGRGIQQDHNSDWSHWGDTLLLIGYKTYINKNLMQQTGGDDKQIFDLDGNQRVVDFKLTPSTGYNLAISQGESSNPNITIPVITIIDTLPKYLRYREGSAYLGGTYRQTAANGGRQGEIIGGTLMDEPVPEEHKAGGSETVKALAWNIEKPASAEDEPIIIESEDGSQTLIWRFYNKGVGDKLPVIYYSADIGDRGNALTDVPEGTTNLVNKVRITAKLDRRHPSVENGNYAEVGIAVTKGAAGAYGKYSFQNAVEEDGTIDYVVYYDNNQDNEIPIAMMDNMPFNGINGNKFTGTYKLTNWKLDTKLCEKSKLTVWYSTDSRYKTLTLTDKDDKKNPVVTIDEANGWKKAVIGADGTLSCPDLDFATLEFGKEGKTFLAWAVTGTLAGSNCVDISMSIQLIPEKPVNGDSVTREIYHYVNLFSTKDTITEIDTPTVKRTLEGLTWMDYNRNGKQDQHQNADEDHLPGVQVTLMKLTDVPEGTKEEEWAKDISHYESVTWPEDSAKAGQPVTILTGQQISLRQVNGEAVNYEKGRYKFTDLPAGIFAVKFTPGSDNADISKMRATIYDSTVGGTTDENDSDGVPVYAGNDDKNGKLEQTYIPQIEMEDAETIYYKKYPNYTQTSPYHDSGFYYNPQLNFHKVGENWQTKLTGATFILSDASGNVMTFMKEDGTYIAPIDLGGVVSRARYYIQYAADPAFVVGVGPNETHDGAWLKLFTKREEDESQLFELFSQADGSFSFRHCATGKWIDLNGGSIENQKEIWLYNDNNVPTNNDNQKWIVEPYGNGSYRIQSVSARRSDSNRGFMDLANRTVANGTQIWGYEGNGTPAQEWQLVPENENSNLKVDASGQLTIKDLLPGEYTLTELETPPGCSMPDHPIKITVNNDGTVSVSENGATQIAGKVETTQNNGTVTNDIKIRNIGLYVLPSTGGIGTYWYTIGGTLLMMAAALILYKKRYAGRC